MTGADIPRMTRIAVTVVPRARSVRVERRADGGFRVAVTAPAHEGRANAAVIEALAEHFGVPRSRVHIVQGLTGRRKVVEIADGGSRAPEGAPAPRRKIPHKRRLR